MCHFDWNLFWTGLSAISAAFSLAAAILIYVLAKNELKKNNELAELDIYFRIKSDLSTPLAQKISQSIFQQTLNFVRNSDGSVEFRILDKTDKTGNTYEPFSLDDMDLGLLNHFEDLALSFDKKLISMDMIRSGYGTLLLNSGNFPAVYNYISYLRNEVFNDQDLYSGFESLYSKLYKELSDQQKKRYRPSIC
jgi:hypothetical protein